MDFQIDPSLTISNDPKVIEINARIGELHDMRKEVERKLGEVKHVDEVTGRVVYTDRANYMDAKAIALMLGKPLSSVSSSASEEYASARDLEVELAAIDKAIEMLNNRMNNAQQLAANRIREKFVPIRRKLVDDMIVAARHLRDTLLAEAAFSVQLGQRSIEAWGQPLNFGVLRIGNSLPPQIIHALNVYLGEATEFGPYPS